MPHFGTHDVDLHYRARGSGDAVVLLHGFTSSLVGTWERPGWLDALAEAGFRALALDFRSHGRSARYVELAGGAHGPFFGEQEALLGEIEEFLTGVRSPPRPDRVLATVLFTDIVGSTEWLARVGDQRWADVVARHHSIVREHLRRFRGSEIDTAGDGFFARFDGPARAVECARAVVVATRAELGIGIRAGAHTGECEMVDGKLGGLAVHVGARIAANAGADEVLVSGTVRDLVAGSGLSFEDRGVRALRGVPGEWRLYALDRLTA